MENTYNGSLMVFNGAIVVFVEKEIICSLFHINGAGNG